MKSNIFFPLAIVAMTTAIAAAPAHSGPSWKESGVFAADTVVYPHDGYRLHRTGTMPEESIPDSILRKAGIKVNILDSEDTNTVVVPLTPEEQARKTEDSLRRAKFHYADSIRNAKLEAKERRDSIRESIPRVLETFAVPDTMQFKRIFRWKVDQDFHNLQTEIPDTTYNEHFYDYPFLKRDVNATWLGVAGSPVQTYDFFKRDIANEGVEFYRAQESWAYSPGNFWQYNSKTPHTELAYFGTILAGSEKESDNLHILTTQNIFPELNFSIQFDRFGGEGILLNEKTTNKNFGIGLNYLGKKYMANAGYLYNMVSRGENGGVADNFWVRDTTVNAREIEVLNKQASSRLSKNTFFLDQQLRIPFDFIHKIRLKKDSTYVKPELDRDITSAFIGHSTEYSNYSRKYTDTGVDTMRVDKLENRLFLRLQPWASDGIISKIDVGVGDRLMSYTYGVKAEGVELSKARENEFFIYAGANGQFKKYIDWNAKAHYNVLGYYIGDFDFSANLNFKMYPFRKARTSPITVGAAFSTSLQHPNFFQQKFSSSLYNWDLTDLKKVSTTKIQGIIDIPYWKLNASVGYALLGNYLYYGNDALPVQAGQAISVLTASIQKNFALGHLHLDNRALIQTSSNQEALPLPLASFNIRWYGEFVLQRYQDNPAPVLTLQAGINAWYNTAWNAPGWNPVSGTFYNQTLNKYNNGPYFDIFVNMQWKRACIFLKLENAGQGWPLRKGKDYFSADHFINTQRGIKIGIFWPFYTQPHVNRTVDIDGGAPSGHGRNND